MVAQCGGNRETAALGVAASQASGWRLGDTVWLAVESPFTKIAGNVRLSPGSSWAAETPTIASAAIAGMISISMALRGHMRLTMPPARVPAQPF